jgi:hypothetical protein
MHRDEFSEALRTALLAALCQEGSPLQAIVQGPRDGSSIVSVSLGGITIERMTVELSGS